MPDREESTLETPGLLREAQLSFLPVDRVPAALEVTELFLDALLESGYVRHNRQRRLLGVAADICASSEALEELVADGAMPGLYADANRWSTELLTLAGAIRDAMRSSPRPAP